MERGGVAGNSSPAFYKIATLAAMMLPAWVRAKERGKREVCINKAGMKAIISANGQDVTER
jgi:hypothetical protein